MNKKGELYCYGCGVKLQFTSKDRVGYIAKSAFENTVHPLCQRCYDIKYHNRITDVETIDADYIIDDFRDIDIELLQSIHRA